MSKNGHHFQESISTLFGLLTIFYCFYIHAFSPKRPLGFDCLFYASQKKCEHVIILCNFQGDSAFRNGLNPL